MWSTVVNESTLGVDRTMSTSPFVRTTHTGGEVAGGHGSCPVESGASEEGSGGEPSDNTGPTHPV